jgi:hypothetical protein
MNRRLIVPLIALLCSTAFGEEFRLQIKTRTVYIVPMANGLDRYLASRLTSSGAVWVVLEPSNADAVITDRVDQTFWDWSNAQYRSGSKTPVPLPSVDVKAASKPAPPQGTVFLVDPRTSIVLWSIYQPAPDSSPGALDQTAGRVANDLKKHLYAK